MKNNTRCSKFYSEVYFENLTMAKGKIYILKTKNPYKTDPLLVATQSINISQNLGGSLGNNTTAILHVESPTLGVLILMVSNNYYFYYSIFIKCANCGLLEKIIREYHYFIKFIVFKQF